MENLVLSYTICRHAVIMVSPVGHERMSRWVARIRFVWLSARPTLMKTELCGEEETSSCGLAHGE
jgi:hypothetical protein